MKNSDLKLSLTTFISKNLPKSLLLDLESGILDAYKKAENITKELFEHTPRNRARGQLRRYLVDERIAGIDQKDLVSVLHTKPRGEHFVLLSVGSITISHLEIEHNSLPRVAKHRSLLSHKNSILEPVNYDLFDTLNEPNLSEQLHIVILAIKPNPKKTEQDRPAEIIIAIPHTTWKGFHLQISVLEMMEYYNDAAQNNLEEQDFAWPTLKQQLLDEERKLGT